MAYNETHAQRIRESLASMDVNFLEKKMFSGICFMVDDKMCCGTHIDKNSGLSLLLCRISEEDAENAMEQPHVTPMMFTGKPMKGFIFVEEAGIESRKDLDKWVRMCVDYNPFAKKSKK